jgi:hypothetical protein
MTRGRRRYVIFPILLGGFLLGCRETANAPAPVNPDGQFHQVDWSTSGSSRQFRFSQRRAQPSSAAAATASVSDGTSASFWAYTDKDAALSVDVLSEDGTWQLYATLTIRRGTLLSRPDGTPFAFRDSIEITMSLDPAALRVDLEPSGLTFNPLVPAQLALSYQGANVDFNGDGLVDALDDYIAQVLLGLSTRAGPDDPWATIPSYNDIVNRVLSANLRHFTGYAVAW